MAQPTNAILVPSPLRPNDLEDNYASAFAIDIKGGHHMYALLSERNAIKEGRREWGMLCTIYDDGENNGTYQLVYNASSTSIIDNLNWRLFSGSLQSVSVGGEWLPSVLSIVDTPPSGMTGGDRFLVATPSFSGFATEYNKVAEWDSSALSGSGDWVYSTPTNGTTLRVDNLPNILFKFLGTWSEGGFWQKEYLSQIRYIQPTSTDGTTYSFTSSLDLVALDAYSYSVYYANFPFTNSGASQLQIDGLGYYPMKKLSGGTLLDLGGGDIVPSVQYHMSWNIDNFLIHNIGGGGITFSLTIGPAEDGTYEDGLFTDFTQSTPIGVPIDRFNEILLALVPPPAPDLNSWSLGGPSFVNGRLSFDSSIPGLSAAPSVGIGGDFNASGFRKGINSYVTQPRVSGDLYYKDYIGILNANVSEGPGDPTPAYQLNGFGNGITGSLVLKLNSVTISNINLAATFNAIDQTNGGANSGLRVTVATSSKFPSGFPFEFFWHRTGEFVIKKEDPNLRQGFNFLELSHILPSKTLTVASFSWVADPSSVATSFSSANINTVQGSNPKFISGIQYWKNLSLKYQVTIQNHVKNTYIASNALSSSSAVPVGINTVNNRLTITNTPIMGPPSPASIQTPTNPDSSQNVIWDYSLNSNVRRLNENISFSMVVLRTVQGTDTSSSTSITNCFVDNYPETSSLLSENFLTETNRLLNGSTKYDNSTNIVQGFQPWNSQSSLQTTSGYTNGLQIINQQLVYPRFNFGNVGVPTTNPNFGLGSPVNYFLCDLTNTGFATTNAAGTSNRTFTRVFRVDPNSNFVVLRFTFSLTNTTFVNSDVTLTGNNCWIEVKLPRDNERATPPSGFEGGAVTGWLDMTKPALPFQWFNGAGVYRGTPTSTVIDVDFGQGKSTTYSGGYVLFRITAPSTWTGSIESITLSTL